jgi:hypothetical protein
MPVPKFLGPLISIPISQPPQPAPAPAPIGGAGANCLSFSMQSQQQSEWCWAATSASISAFYGPGSPATQCQIAASCLTLACCSQPFPSTCNQAYYLDRALTVVGHLAAPPSSGALPFASVTNEINAGRPLGCHITWSDGSGHFNAIYGYDASVFDVDVGDPYYGNQTLPYSAMTNSYQGSGVWDYSYLTS